MIARALHVSDSALSCRYLSVKSWDSSGSYERNEIFEAASSSAFIWTIIFDRLMRALREDQDLPVLNPV